MKDRSEKEMPPENKNWFKLLDDDRIKSAALQSGYSIRTQYSRYRGDPTACHTVQWMWDTLEPINKEIDSEYVIIPIRVVYIDKNNIYAAMRIVFSETTTLRKKNLKLDTIDRKSFKLKPDGRKFYYRVFHRRFLPIESSKPRVFDPKPIKQLRKIREVHPRDRLYNLKRQIARKCKSEEDCKNVHTMYRKVIK